RLLLTTETPISEIALACGLTDQSHLTRIFKRSVGMPPAAWRRQFGHCVEVDLSNSEGGGDTPAPGLMNVIIGGADETRGFEDQRLRPGDIFIFQKSDRSVDAVTSIWDQLEVVVVLPNEQTHKRRMICKQLPPVDLANEPASDGGRDSESR
ncbi:MAG: helix-turn-helix transcriptional regulator, partial [Hyphomicrobiales bacterium]|nr:helix-turn-helix transcriptional regulator [Hyphomicrobiales bacterium]